MTKAIPNSKLRNVAGAFPTGISVVCVRDQEGNIVGMTVNSFLSVSLKPALILFSADNESHFFKHCKIGSPLSFNMLTDKQKHLSDVFSGSLHDKSLVDFEEIDGFPIFKDAMAWYKTHIDSIIKSGDHHLVICKIFDCWRNEKREPLLFYNGYRTIGPELKEQ
jgi:flavin reductase (DIM6/NTAB) family NADH-FMN oxidoreductase RutF